MDKITNTEPIPRKPRQQTGEYLRFAKGRYIQLYTDVPKEVMETNKITVYQNVINII